MLLCSSPKPKNSHTQYHIALNYSVFLSAKELNHEQRSSIRKWLAIITSTIRASFTDAKTSVLKIKLRVGAFWSGYKIAPQSEKKRIYMYIWKTAAARCWHVSKEAVARHLVTMTTTFYREHNSLRITIFSNVNMWECTQYSLKCSSTKSISYNSNKYFQ